MIFIVHTSIDSYSKQQLKELSQKLLDKQKHWTKKELENLIDKELFSYKNKEEIIKRISTYSYGENGYFWIYDSNYITILNPNQKEFLDQDASFYQDVNGDFVIKNIVDTALKNQNGIFIEYLWQKPSKENESYKKISYVKYIKELDWIIGTGVYFDDIKKILDDEKHLHEDKMKDLYTRIYIFVFISLICVLISSVYIINKIKKQFLNYSDLLQDANKNLEEKVDERTKELNELNESLEEKIEAKSRDISEILSRFKFVADTILAGYWEIDLKEDTLYFSDGWYKYLDYNKEDFEGLKTQKVFEKIVYPEDLKKVETAFYNHILGKNKKYDVEFRIITKEGTQKWINAKGTIYKDKFFGFNIDIEELKSANTTLLEQAKMSSLGDMIGNIAHQWRQPLSVISTAATGIKFKKDFDQLDDKYLYYSVDKINESAQYLSETINTFRNFVREDKEINEVILQDRIDNAIDIVEHTLKNNFIELIKHIDYSEPIKIKLVMGELSQVLINIITNAKDALLKYEVENPWIKISLEKIENRVLICIEDNGGGIPDNIISKIFEPYFTTKHESQGTGLGLHMSYRIVTESLKGKLFVKNTQNGAKFMIELPLDY